MERKMTISYEQYQAARAEAGAVNNALDSHGFDTPHPEEAALLARAAAAKAVCDAWWEQADPLVDAHNARMQAAGEAE